MKQLMMLVFGVATLGQGLIAGGPSDGNRLLAQARAATAKYHSVEVALADGYERVSPCEPGMGYHYLNSNLVGSGLTETSPQLLLYEDSPNGLRLVGIEYFVPALTSETGSITPWFAHEPPVSGFINPAPVLFAGQVFNGPMAGHAPGMPWHYDLHVYLWKHNPDGIFATHNPKVTCY